MTNDDDLHVFYSCDGYAMSSREMKSNNCSKSTLADESIKEGLNSRSGQHWGWCPADIRRR
jgi:hypothetical protein